VYCLLKERPKNLLNIAAAAALLLLVNEPYLIIFMQLS